MQEEREIVPTTREVVIDAAASERIAHDLWLFALTRPAVVNLGIAVELIVVGVLLLTGRELTLFLVLFGLLFPVLYVLSLRRQTRRRAIASAPIGSRYAVGLGETAISMEGPQGTATINYSAYRRILVRPHVVILQQNAARSYSAMPRELFSDADLVRLHAAIPGS